MTTPKTYWAINNEDATFEDVTVTGTLATTGALTASSTLAVTGAITASAGLSLPTQTLTDDGAITLLKGGVVELNKAGAIAATLAAPTANGCILMISSKTAQAHTVTVTGGLHGLGAGEDVGTFSGAIDDCLILASINDKWVQVANVGVTFA